MDKIDTTIHKTPLPSGGVGDGPSPLPHREGQGVGSLFTTFFKIGAVTFGGGYAMIPIIETEVVEKHKWVNKEELLDLIAIAQSTPGVFAVNISTFIGYKLRGTKGAICATVSSKTTRLLPRYSTGYAPRWSHL